MKKRLSHRMIHSGLWVLLTRAAQQAVGFLRIIVLARILAPEDFGLMGIALLVMTALETFTQTGFQSALVQRKGDIAGYLDAAWTMLVIRGLAIFAFLFLAAPAAASFFGTPKAEAVIRVIGLSVVISAFSNIGIVVFQKELDFKKLAGYHLSTAVADFVVAVGLAYLLKDAWALVFGLLSASVVGCAVSYLIHPYRPGFDLDREKIRELFSFGKWVLGSSVLVYLVSQGDGLLVGKMLGVTALGFYQLAAKIANTPATEIVHIVSQVTLPAYSSLQDNNARLRSAFIKVSGVTSVLSFGVAGMVGFLAPELVELFLGAKWRPVIPLLQVLAGAGLLRALSANSGYVFYAVGKPGIDTRLQFIRFAALILLLYPLTAAAGILGTSLAVFFSVLIAYIGYYAKTLEVVGCSFLGLGRIVFVPLLAASFMGCGLFVLKLYFTATLYGVAVLVLSGTVFYLAAVFALDVLFNSRRLGAAFLETFAAVRPA